MPNISKLFSLLYGSIRGKAANMTSLLIDLICGKMKLKKVF
jgi:hypothetical protein